MTDQAYTIHTKEYMANNELLIIENIFDNSRRKTEIIKEIIRYMNYSDDKYLG